MRRKRFFARHTRNRHDDAHHQKRRHNRRPARRNERQGLARRGKQSRSAGHIQKRLPYKHAGKAAGDHRAEIVAGSLGDKQTAHEHCHKKRDDEQRTDKAELLADNRENEVGFSLGQIQELLA